MKRSSTRLASKKTSYAISGSSKEDDKAEIEDSNEKAKSTKTPSKKKIKKDRQDSEKNNNKKVLFQNAKTSKDVKEDSSSESDIENYLQPVDEIDLNSDFFQVKKQNEDVKSFDAIENDIFSGVNRLSDSESEDEEFQEEMKQVKVAKRFKKANVKVTTRESFAQIQEYAMKIEETKKVVQRYEAKRKTQEGKQKFSLKTNGDNLNVSQLLALGERDTSGELAGTSETIKSDFESHSESEKEDWEEVEGKQADNVVIPKEGLQVNVELPVVMRKKKGTDLMASIKRRLNRIRKQNQILVHKVHLLCWIAYGNYINRTLNNEFLLGMALSLIPSELCRFGKVTNMKDLEKLIGWYQSAIENIEKCAPEITLLKLMKLQIINKKVFSKEMFIFLLICILRGLGINCRLVLSFRVAPLRPPDSELHFLGKKAVDENEKDKKRKSKRNSSSFSQEEEIEDLIENSEKQKTQNKKSKLNCEKKNKSEEKQTKEKSTDEVKKNNEKPKRKSTNNKKENMIESEKNKKPTSKDDKVKKEKVKQSDNNVNNKVGDKHENNTKSQRKSKRLSCKKIPQLDGVFDDDEDKNSDNSNESNTNDSNKHSSKRLSQRKRILHSYVEPDSDEDFVPIKSKSFKKSETEKDKKKSDVSKPIQSKQAKSKKNVVKSRNKDSDYIPETSKKQDDDDSDDQFYVNTEIKVKQRLQSKKENRKDVIDKKGIDVWIEVYVKSEKRWISVDVIKGQVNCASEIYSRASHPITYIIAWNNNNTIKDVTQRYCPNCNTVTRKLRTDKKWWNETIEPFEDEENEQNKKEDEELMKMQIEKPLPTTISEYKNHPLYALKRHFLKFQALYPPEPPILGYIRKEAVYPRECVHTLYSREKWIKEAKVVKPGEKAYKIVFRPTWDKIKREILKNQPLEIFGSWQVQDYEPPTAENGIVPRNEYGNVELFKPCMLPKGCAHLELEGLSKLARKMGIDCAPAITGFDVSHGWIHPVYEGYVVCEEYEDVLVGAWYLEQEELEKREEEKLEKRVYGNWKRLIKGLLIRERLNAKYNFAGPAQSDKTTPSKEIKEVKKPSKKRSGKMHKPDSESDECENK